MSMHEMLLSQRFYGFGVMWFLGMGVTLCVVASCICRITAMQPREWWRIPFELVIYLAFGAWAVEAFMDLVFIRMYAGHDVAIGGIALLHLQTTHRNWLGDDCVWDTVIKWRKRGRTFWRAHHHYLT